MKNWFKHYISPHVGIITTIFMGFLTITQIIIDWCGIKISHMIALIFIGILYLLSIIIDIYYDRLVLKKKLSKIEENNNGLQQNIEQLESDKQILESDLKLQRVRISFLINNIPKNRIKFVEEQIQLFKEAIDVEKTNQSSKNNQYH